MKAQSCNALPSTQTLHSFCCLGMSWELNNNNDYDEVNTSKAGRAVMFRVVAAYCNVITAVLSQWPRIYMFC